MQARLEYQAGHAIVWRDAIVQYFLKQSGIPDDKGRAGHYPGRLEAEDGEADGIQGDRCDAVGGCVGRQGCVAARTRSGCSAEWTWKGAAGQFDVAVEYFDLQGGAAKFALLVNGKAVGGVDGGCGVAFAAAARG